MIKIEKIGSLLELHERDDFEIVGDDLSKCHLAIFSDADFAGSLLDSKSTSGCFVAVVGPNTFAPLTAICKIQSCVRHSSTETEIVALDFALRTEGLPLLMLMQRLTGGLYDAEKHGASFHGQKPLSLRTTKPLSKLCKRKGPWHCGTS